MFVLIKINIIHLYIVLLIIRSQIKDTNSKNKTIDFLNCKQELLSK